MKIPTACEICGKRAKRIALEKGKKMCTKHYNMSLKEANNTD